MRVLTFAVLCLLFVGCQPTEVKMRRDGWIKKEEAFIQLEETPKQIVKETPKVPKKQWHLRIYDGQNMVYDGVYVEQGPNNTSTLSIRSWKDEKGLEHWISWDARLKFYYDEHFVEEAK
jgi:hypothetical protein